MWQPNRAQWTILWIVAVLLVLGWPPETGRSLGVKAAQWAVDPAGSLPTLPPPLPMSLDDDGDAVTAHDAQERDYYRAYDASAWTRWRLKVKDARDPIEPATLRQLLVGAAVLSALGVWRLNRPTQPIG